MTDQQESYLGLYGLQLLKNGFNITPIKPGTKHPGLAGWQTLQADESRLRAWLSNGYAHGGVGINTKHNPAVDLDILDSDACQRMGAWCLEQIGPAPARVGQAPKQALIYRTSHPFTKVTSNTYVDWEDREHKVEILGDGQQLVAYAKHPGTGQPYTWTGDGLAGIHSDSLTEMTLEQARALVAEFHRLADELGWELKSTGSGGQALDPDMDTDERALANYKPTLGWSLDDARSRLKHIPADARDTWISVGMALHHEFSGSDDGFQLWDEWSATSPNYGGVEAWRWERFGANLETTNPKTARSIQALAKEHRAKQIATSGSTFSTFSWSDLSDAEIPPRQLVEDLLVYGQSCLISAQPNTGKSAFILDLAICVASGQNWRDKRVEQGAVLYVAAESPETIRARMLAQRRRDGISTLPLDVVQERTALTTDEQREAFKAKMLAYVAANPTTNLVILDTFRASTPGLDENTSVEMGAVVGFLHALAAELMIHIVIIHHTTKAGTTYAGSGAFGGIVDTEILIQEGEKEYAGLVCAVVKQQRGLNSRASEFWYEIQGEETGRTTNFGTPETAPLIEHLTEADLAFRKAEIEEAGEEEQHREREARCREILNAMVQGHTSRRALEVQLAMPNTRVTALREWMKEEGWIAHNGKSGGASGWVITESGKAFLGGVL